MQELQIIIQNHQSVFQMVRVNCYNLLQTYQSFILGNIKIMQNPKLQQLVTFSSNQLRKQLKNKCDFPFLHKRKKYSSSGRKLLSQRYKPNQHNQSNQNIIHTQEQTQSKNQFVSQNLAEITFYPTNQEQRKEGKDKKKKEKLPQVFRISLSSSKKKKILQKDSSIDHSEQKRSLEKMKECAIGLNNNNIKNIEAERDGREKVRRQKLRVAKTLSNQNYDLNIEGGSRNYPHFKRYNSITYNKEMDNDMGIEIIKKVRRRRFLG